MKRFSMIAVTALATAFSLAVFAQDRTATSIVGWRGDGTGRYPDATPPIHWGINSKVVKELSSQCKRPKDADTGKPIPDGVIRSWLLLVDYAGALAEGDAAKALVDSSPDENDKVGDLSWKAIAADTSTLDVNALAEKGKVTSKSLAFAHAYVYSPSAQTITLQGMFDGLATLWVNGKLIAKGESGQTAAWRLNLNLVKGWNRVLVKATKGPRNWFVRTDLYGTMGGAFDKSANFLWTLPITGHGGTSPIIVGNRLFINEECATLTCVDKLSGKVLWKRTFTYADAATEEEKKAHPELFEKIEPLMAQIRELNGKNSNSIALEKSVNELMNKVDPKKYVLSYSGDMGYSLATPTSDGSNVYVVNGLGLAACYDLEGNRKWLTVMQFVTGEHGHGSSPLLVDGVVVVFYIHWDTKLPTSAAGLDAKTGAVVWTYNKPALYAFYASPVKLALKGRNFFATSVWIGSPKDGAMIHDRGGFGGNMDIVMIPSSVVNGNTVYSLAGGALEAVTVDPETLKTSVKSVPFSVHPYPRWYEAWNISSPLYHEGLVYCMTDDGVLTVVDVKEYKVVYQKFLDLGLFMHHNLYTSRGGAGSSITLAGKYLYVFGNSGVCLVLEPGRVYKEIARNRIENGLARSTSHGYEHQETFASCPVFDGKRMYLAAESNLYCIGEK